jgi:hypothetical protein
MNIPKSHEDMFWLMAKPGRVDGLCEYIRRWPKPATKAWCGPKSLTRDEYLALKSVDRALFLHNGGTIRHEQISRATFDKKSPRQKSEFVKSGGRLKNE